MSHDVIVLGAGLDGLAAAGLLAKHGARVLVLEPRASVGGTHATTEIAPGYRCDAVEHDLGWLPPALLRELAPERFGAAPLRPDACATMLAPDGRALTLWGDRTRTVAEIARSSRTDAERWPALAARVARLAGFLEALYAAPAPRPLGAAAGDVVAAMGLGRRARSLGREGIFDLLRTLPLSVADLLAECVSDDTLAGLLAADGVMGLMQGPRSGGTAFMMMHRHVGAPAGAIRSRWIARGGMGALAEALAASARANGATIRTGADTARILVRDERVRGVVLASGEEITARTVLSTLDARRTMLDLIEPEHVAPELARSLARIRCRGALAKVNLALDGLPPLGPRTDGRTLGTEQLMGALVIAPGVRALERAYDAAKYGGVSERPMLEARVPSMHDASLAPPGHHVMSVMAQWAPYHLGDGEWSDARRDALGDLVVRTLDEALPGVAARVIHRQVITPRDLERDYGCPEGSLTHGELALDQILFMRPVPACADHRTPVAGLFLGGRGTHPGLPGASGTLAAAVVRKALREMPGS